MTKRFAIVLSISSVLCVAIPRQCLGLDLAFKQQFNQMCRGPLLRDSPEVCRRKVEASQAAARQIVAQGVRVVPQVMMELGPHPRMHYARDLLTAIGPPSHDALRRGLSTARGTILLGTIGKMGYGAKPLIPDLLQQLQRSGRKTEFDATIITTLLRVGADRKKMAARLNAIVTAPQPNIDLIHLAPALVALGPDAAAVMPAAGRWLGKHLDQKYFDTTIRELPSLGPVAAPLTQPLVDYYRAHPPRSGYSDNAALVFGSIGPGAKASLPLLESWLKKGSGRSYSSPYRLLIATAAACVEGQPNKAVPGVQKRVAQALTSRSKTAGYPLMVGLRAIGMIAKSHPQAARPLVRLVSRALKARKRGSTMTAAIVVRDMKPSLALQTLPDLIQSTSGVYDGEKPSYFSSYGRSVEALRALAPYDKRARAALDRLSKTDPHIRIRNMAREAVIYADAVGPLRAR